MVFLNRPMADAERAEWCLHEYFSRHSAFGLFSRRPDFPLAGNGQSELYYRDVLELDDMFTWEQGDSTRRNVQKVIRFSKPGELSRLQICGRVLGFALLKIVVVSIEYAVLALQKLWIRVFGRPHWTEPEPVRSNGNPYVEQLLLTLRETKAAAVRLRRRAMLEQLGIKSNYNKAKEATTILTPGALKPP